MLPQQNSKMWEWLRNWGVGTEANIDERPKCLEVAINGCHRVFNKAGGEGWQEGEVIVT